MADSARSETSLFVGGDVRVRPVVEGKWSGGGHVMLANLREAVGQRPDVLSMTEGLPLFVRNHAPLDHLLSGRFLLMPQNAWPWHWTSPSASELSRQSALRAASEVSMRRAAGVLRISGAIPTRGRTAPAILHNVLDAGFDELAASTPDLPELPPRFFLCAGSVTGYRNLGRLRAAHVSYRKSGGDVPLVVAGGESAASEAWLRDLVRDDEAIVYVGPQDRRSVLGLLRASAAALLPSLVEASPIGLLEALVLAPRVAASDIVGHRELAGKYSAEVDWFDPLDVSAITSTLHSLEHAAPAATPTGLSSAGERRTVRQSWSDDLASVIERMAQAAVGGIR